MRVSQQLDKKNRKEVSVDFLLCLHEDAAEEVVVAADATAEFPLILQLLHHPCTDQFAGNVEAELLPQLRLLLVVVLFPDLFLLQLHFNVPATSAITMEMVVALDQRSSKAVSTTSMHSSDMWRSNLLSSALEARFALTAIWNLLPLEGADLLGYLLQRPEDGHMLAVECQLEKEGAEKNSHWVGISPACLVGRVQVALPGAAQLVRHFSVLRYIF